MEADTFSVCREKLCDDQPLTQKWELFAESIVLETKEEMEIKITELEEKLATLDKFKNSKMYNDDFFKDREFFIRYLRGANWDVATALDLIWNSYQQVQDFYPYMSVGPPSALDRVWNARLLFVPEFRDTHGRRLLIMRLGRWNPDVIPIKEFFTATYTMFELLATEPRTQIAGITIIVDVKDFSVSHLKWLNLEMLRCLGNFLTGAFPVWMRKIHIIHNHRAFNYLFKLHQVFLGERVRGNFILHESNISSLQKYVPPAMLPENLEGELVEEEEQAHVQAAVRLDEYFRLRIIHAEKLLEK